MMKDGLEQIQQEKQALEMKLDSETKRTSMTLGELEKQKQLIIELKDEVKLLKHQCEQLQNEKSKTQQRQKRRGSSWNVKNYLRNRILKTKAGRVLYFT